MANGLVSLGDAVRELPAPHHLRPCACCLCRETRPIWTVQAIGECTCEVYLVREDGYRCPALEVERISSGAGSRLAAYVPTTRIGIWPDASNDASSATSVTAPEERGVYVGASVRRREDPRLITGRGTYVDDVAVTGCAEVIFVRSPHAHARIGAIDAERVRSAPGVVAVITGADIAASMQPVPCIWTIPDMKAPTRRAITFDKARCVGDIVAAVVGTTESAARDAAELVDVDYEVLPAVTDQDVAMQPDAPLLHDDVPGNVAFTWELSGGDQSVFDTADVRIPLRLVNQRLVSNFMETRGVLAQWNDGTHELTVWSSTQIPHLVRLQLARVLGLAENTIRVIAPEVGGGFGSKQNFYPEEMLVSALSMRLNRPVKWIEDRSEHYVATTQGRAHIQDAELVGRRDATILGLRVRSRANLGAYFSMFAPAVPTGLFGLMLCGAYNIPSVACHVDAVLTNTTTVDAYRGAGRPEATHLVERLVDMFADEIGMDPVEVRRLNFVRPEQFPHTTATYLSFAQDGSIETARVGITGVAAKAYRAKATEGSLAGRMPTGPTLDEAATYAVDGVDVSGDLHASSEYRAHLVRVYTRRALETAFTRARVA